MRKMFMSGFGYGMGLIGGVIATGGIILSGCFVVYVVASKIRNKMNNSSEDGVTE